MRDLGDGIGVLDGPEEIRRLNQDAGGIRRDGFFQLFQIDAAVVLERNRRKRKILMMRVSSKNLAVFGMHTASDDHRTPSGEADCHHHAFGGRGGTVVHGSVRNFHASEFADHGLELEDSLQSALGNLRLIRRVGSQKLAARDERIDDDRPVVRIGSGAEKTGVAVAVFAGALAKPVHNFGFRHLTRNFQVAIEPVFRRDGSKQIVDRARADGLQHGFAVGGRFRQITHRDYLDVSRSQFDC